MMMDIGLSALFCELLLAWKAARIFAVIASLRLVELVLPLELLLKLESELVPELGGGSGAPLGPTMACARSSTLGRSPEVLALLKSAASVESWVASVVLPSEDAVEAALLRLVAICDITDLYSEGLDCWSFWSMLSNSASGES
jgi:hypothetical protein